MPSAVGTSASRRRSSSVRARRSGSGQAELAVGEVGRTQPGVDRLGRRRRGDQREVRRRDGRAQGVEDERGQRRRVGGGQQGVDVGEQQDGGRVRARGGAGGPDHVVHARRRGRRLEGGDRGGGELDAAGADGRGGAAHERRLADPLGAGDEHAQPRRAAEAGEQLGAAEGQLEPLDEAPRGVGVADEIVDVENGLGGSQGRRSPTASARRLPAAAVRVPPGWPYCDPSCEQSHRAAPHRRPPSAGRRTVLRRSWQSGHRRCHRRSCRHVRAPRTVALPADHRRRHHGDRPRRLRPRHRQQLGRPRPAHRTGQPPARGRDVEARGGLHVLREERDGVAAGDDLAQQRQPRRLRGQPGAGQPGAGQQHPAGGGRRAPARRRPPRRR